MQEVSKLFSGNGFAGEKWLIIGKGPSYDDIAQYDLSLYKTIGLNHVVKDCHLTIAHMIDFDAFEECAQDIYDNARYLVMPLNPHFDNKPSQKTLGQLVASNQTLKQLDGEGRLFWYNHLSSSNLLSLGNIKRVFYPKVKVENFSAEAVLYILSMNGIKDIYSIGIDGGTQYSKKFDEKTLLSNGQTDFNTQFNNMVATIKKFDVVYSPLTADYPVKVYVGTQEEQMLATDVLEYSIKKHTDVAVEVIPLHRSNITYREPKDEDNRQRTPFSFQRFLIPELNGHEGRAIYVDSDMQVFKDIRQLWNLPMGAHDLLTVEPTKETGRALQFSVMLLDCEALGWEIEKIIDQLDSGELNYITLMREMKVTKDLGVTIPASWNCLEWYKEGETALLHYTDMPRQPWISIKNPLGHIWVSDLIEAIDEGFISMDYVKDHAEKSWIRPSLLYQIEHRITNTLKLPQEAYKLDEGYIAPYQHMPHVKQASAATKAA